MSTAFRERTILACRKRHECQWCRETIEVGESCRYWCGTFDGDFYGYYIHTDCAEAVHRDEDLWEDAGMPPDAQLRGMTQRETEEAMLHEH